MLFRVLNTLQWIFHPRLRGAVLESLWSTEDSYLFQKWNIFFFFIVLWDVTAVCVWACACMCERRASEATLLEHPVTRRVPRGFEAFRRFRESSRRVWKPRQMRIAGDDVRGASGSDGHSCGWLACDRIVNREDVASDLFSIYHISYS